jgi:hypothetical protein
MAGGINKDPYIVDPKDFLIYNSTLVFDPHGGVVPQILSLTLESTNQVRLSWQGEAGRLYGVESTRNLATGPWTTVNLGTGTNSILATNASVEASCTVPSADPERFFRVRRLIEPGWRREEDSPENDVLSGFTLTNGATQSQGDGAAVGGGGAWCASMNAVLTNCVIVGNPRIVSGTVDIGAYEFHAPRPTLDGPHAAPAPVAARSARSRSSRVGWE